MAGRKLSFNPDVALEQMTRVFWEKGYAGTSVDDLCRAVGVPKPSLYSYFGDKEEILKRALHFFGERSSQRNPIYRAMKGNLSKRLTQLMISSAERKSEGAAPPIGCLFVNITTELQGQSKSIDQILEELNELNEIGLIEFFKDAKGKGEIPSEARPRDLAILVNTFIKGLAVEHRAGVAPKILMERASRLAELLATSFSA